MCIFILLKKSTVLHFQEDNKRPGLCLKNGNWSGAQKLLPFNGKRVHVTSALSVSFGDILAAKVIDCQWQTTK